jgi:hypothetical protein
MSARQHGSGLPGINTQYTTAAGSKPIPSAANLLASGSLPGTVFILTDTGEWLALTLVGTTPLLFQIAGIGQGEIVQVTMLAGQSLVSHADTGIGASSVLGFAVTQATPDTAATRFSVVLNAGVGWSIRANAAANADTVINVWVVRY